MSIYTVHEPPPKADEDAADPTRFVFVRDGFSFWAFLLTGLWMLRHRLWLVLLGYLVVVIALQVVVYLLGASGSVMFIVGFLLSLLVGFEASVGGVEAAAMPGSRRSRAVSAGGAVEDVGAVGGVGVVCSHPCRVERRAGVV